MKRIFFLFFLCCMTTLATFAQEKKAYTLEDVIPGGNNYFNLVPENIPGLQWWGDVCVRADVENIRSIQLKDGKESILVTLEEVNQAIEKEKTLSAIARAKTASQPDVSFIALGRA